MKEFEFLYFADAQNFAYMTQGVVACHFCGKDRACLDAGHFYGEEEIKAVCTECMKKGRLKDLDIAVNDIDTSGLAGTKEEVRAIAEEIVHRTPKVPTWQASMWPVRDGKAYRFIKIASKLDYTRGASEEEGKKIFSKSLRYDTIDDIDWLWSNLPEHPIRNIEEGQYDVSCYLFESDGVLLTTWDAN